MGADNWAICPVCRVEAIKAREKRYTKADAAYGKKPQGDYIALLAEAEKPIQLEQTLREDYGLGVGVDGVFGVSYRAHCTACQFAFEYKHDEVAQKIPSEYTENATNDDPYGYNYRR